MNPPFLCFPEKIPIYGLSPLTLLIPKPKAGRTTLIWSVICLSINFSPRRHSWKLPQSPQHRKPGFLQPKALILHLSMVLGTVSTDKNSTAMTLYPQSGENINNRAKCEDGGKLRSKPDARLVLLSRQSHWTLGSAHCVIISWVISLVLCHTHNSSFKHTSASSDLQDFRAAISQEHRSKKHFSYVQICPSACMDKRASFF